MSPKPNPYRIALIIGTIGSGKSSLSRELGKELDALTLLEQAQEEGNPYIDSFYKDMKRWAATLQVHQLTVRFAQHRLAQDWVAARRGHAVIDGGFWLDTCFARMIRKEGLMEEREFETYRTLFSHMTGFVNYPNVVIRLLTSPSIAAQRVERRASELITRSTEAEKVNETYLANLDLEISALCSELSNMGVAIINTFWDEDREDQKQREQAVKGLAYRIRELQVPDPFLANWKRAVCP